MGSGSALQDNYFSRVGKGPLHCLACNSIHTIGLPHFFFLGHFPLYLERTYLAVISVFELFSGLLIGLGQFPSLPLDEMSEEHHSDEEI